MARLELIVAGFFVMVLWFAFVPVMGILSGLSATTLEGAVLSYIGYIVGLFLIIYGAVAK